MTIGNVIKKSFKSGDKDITYIEMIVRPPFSQSATFTITKNKNKDKETAPDWYINYSYNRKGESYRRVRAGALWEKTKDDLKYKTGYIESPIFANGKINITLFKPTKFEDEKDEPFWLYDVVYNAPTQEQKRDVVINEYNEPMPNYEMSEADVDDENIPF